MKRIFFVLSLGLILSCNKESVDPVVQDSELSVSVSELQVSGDGESKSFKITSNTSWTITGAKGWLDVDPKSGEGNKVVVVTVGNNDNTKERECTLRVITDDNVVTAEVLVIQDAAEAELEVDVENLILSSKEGSSSTFKVKSSGKWTIEGKPEWLDMSSTSGSGEVSVVVTAVTTNYSASDRQATLTVSSEGLSKTILVSQKPEWLTTCVAKPKGLTILANCVGFGWEFTDDVAYYYYAELEKSEAVRMTTLEIVNYVIENGDRDTPSDGYINSTGYLYPETEYVLYTVAFNEDGAQGILYSQDFTTKSDYNQPDAYIYDLSYDYVYWYWYTTIGAYAKSYYMWTTQNESYMNLTDGLVAYIVKRDIEQNPKVHTPILQSGAWQASMTNLSIMIVTWGIGSDNELSGYIDTYTGSVYDDYSVRETSVSERKRHLTYDEYIEVMSSLTRVF